MSDENGLALRKSANSDESSSMSDSEEGDTKSPDLGEEGTPKYNQANPDALPEEERKKEGDFRKKLNRDAREIVSLSIHKNVKLIVHRPDHSREDIQEYGCLCRELMPIIREVARKTLPLLKYEMSIDLAKNHYYGSRFQAESLAYKDFRYFSRKLPPTEAPSLAVGLRIDESASMLAYGRMEAAKRAAVAVYEFCELCAIPILIYGDTADVSRLEQMSVFAYTDFDKKDNNDRYRLMGIHGRSNNRDGMALRIIADRLAGSASKTKLLISISDGQPKAMDDYTGCRAVQDMQQTITEYERKGITFLAAAIGQDKEVISQIYGKERFLDITDLKEFPARLVRVIARYL